MTLDVYFREDIARGIIATTLIAVKVYLANTAANVEHLQGILDHARAQAALYGIAWPPILEEVKRHLSLDGQTGLMKQAAKLVTRADAQNLPG